MTYGQVILILFVVLIGYYGFLIFMDIQHLKATEAAAQENQSVEEIDITDEARSFQPHQVSRNDKKKEEAGNESTSEDEKQQTASDEQSNENASSEREDTPSKQEEESTAKHTDDSPVSTENPASEPESQAQTTEPDKAEAASAPESIDEDEKEDTTNEDAEAAPSEAEASTGSNFSPSYREPILTDGILVDDIFKAIDQLAETGTCDLGTIIYHCESMRYAG